MEQFDQPLANRLRNAALDRTHSGSEKVDEDFVLDPDGVIDLRELRANDDGRSIAAPAPVLATIRGQLGDAAEISELYDESDHVPRWRLGLRARHAFGMGSNRAAGTADVAADDTNGDVTVDASVEDAPEPVADLPRLSAVSDVIDLRPKLAEVQLADDHTDEPHTDDEDAAEASDAATDDVEAEMAGDTIEALDDNEDRPEAECPECLGVGHQDLYDRFSQMEFYSCDSCNHMWQQPRD